jgi:hypothetical protein
MFGSPAARRSLSKSQGATLGMAPVALCPRLTTGLPFSLLEKNYKNNDIIYFYFCQYFFHYFSNTFEFKNHQAGDFHLYLFSSPAPPIKPLSLVILCLPG